MLQKAYEERCTLPVAAERLADLRDRLYYIASVYAELPMGPDEQYVKDADLDPAENRRALDNEAFSDELATALDRILREEYPVEILQHLPDPLSESFTGTLPDTQPILPSIAAIIAAGETTRTEFKSTLRVNLHTGQPDKKMEHGCLKTVAAFLNSAGGHLLIGVDDSRKVVGIDADGFPNEDRMHLHLVNLIRDRIGAQHAALVESFFESVGGERVLVVRCKESRIPVYVKDETGQERFFVRMGVATTELSVSQFHDYAKHRFDQAGQT